MVRDTEPTVTARVAGDGGTVDAGTVTFTSGDTVLGTAPVRQGVATLTLPAYQGVGRQTVTAGFSGTSAFAPSSGEVVFDVVKATPAMDVQVRPGTIHKKTTHPRLDVSLTARGQVVSGYVVVRQDGDLLAFEQLVDGQAGVVLPTYQKKGEQTVRVEYLGSDLAEPVSRTVRFTVVN